MTLHVFLQLCVASVLINNMVFSLTIGVCPAFGPNHRLSSAVGIGISAIFVMGFTSVLTWAFNRYVLVPLDIAYLQILVFILLIVSFVQFLEIMLQKFRPVLYDAFGAHLSVLSTNCAVVAASLFGAGQNPITGLPFSCPDAFVNGIASGTGFLLALVLMSGIRMRLELSHVPGPLRGLPVTFVSAGLISLAFLGFSGLSFDSLFGG
jgi:Na+-translocating ferredoxin:NAD+ oxidoreductase subunit A